MKNLNLSILTSILFLLLLSNSCLEISDSVSEPTPSPATVESLFNFTEGLTLQLAIPNLEDLLIFEDHLILTNGRRLIVRKDINFSTVNTIDELFFHSNILEYQGQIMVCAEQGIFTIDSEINLVKQNEMDCQHLAIGPEGQILFVPLVDINRPFNTIFELSDDFQSATPYTINDANTPEDQIVEFTFTSNGDLWASTAEGSLLWYENQTFKMEFNENNSPLTTKGSVSSLLLMPYMDDLMVVVAGNESGVETILKHSKGKWITLKDFRAIDPANLVDVSIANSQPSDIFIFNDLLYIPLPCKNFLVANPMINVEFSPEDYSLIEDPDLSVNLCVNKMYYYDASKFMYIFNNSGRAYRFTLE